MLAGTKRHRELRDDIDLQPLEKKKRQRQLQYEIAELEAKLRAMKNPSPPAAPQESTDPIQREVDRVANKIRTENGLLAASDKMVGENPDQEDQIKRAFRKRIERLREEE